MPVNSQQLTVNSESPRLPVSPSPRLRSLDSSQECVEKLTEAAIAHSSKLKTLDERIALVNERLELMGERIDYSQNRQWTNYITLDPIKLVQNLFGGGDVQRDRIAIADLEVKAATLEAARAELERQREEVKSQLREKVLALVLDYEAAQRQYSLAQSKLTTYNQQRQIIEIGYRLGRGLQEVESKLDEIVAVRSPYSGRVRRVKTIQNSKLSIQNCNQWGLVPTTD